MKILVEKWWYRPRVYRMYGNFYQILLQIRKISSFLGFFGIKTLKNYENFLLSLILAENPQNWREFFLTFLLALKLLGKFSRQYSKFDYFILKSIKNANFLIILCQNRIFFSLWKSVFSPKWFKKFSDRSLRSLADCESSCFHSYFVALQSLKIN